MFGGKWRDFKVDEAKWDSIHKIVVMYYVQNSQSYGFKFEDKDGNNLVSTELFYDKEFTKDKDVRFVEFTLNEGERFTGVRSSAYLKNFALHYGV